MKYMLRRLGDFDNDFSGAASFEMAAELHIENG